MKSLQIGGINRPWDIQIFASKKDIYETIAMTAHPHHLMHKDLTISFFAVDRMAEDRGILQPVTRSLAPEAMKGGLEP